jgi:peptidoglycan hydrolase CwlO-like protein
MDTAHDTRSRRPATARPRRPRCESAHRRPNRCRRTAIVAGLLACLCAVLVPAAAAEPGDVTTITATKKPTTLAELQKASRATRKEMHRLETKMRAIVAEYNVARGRLDAISSELADVRLRLARSRGELDEQSTIVGRRLEAMYKLGEYTWLDILVNSDSLSDARSQYTFFKLLAEQDQLAGDELGRLNAEVDQLAATLAERRSQALVVEEEIDAQRRELEDALAQRRALLDELVARIEKIIAARGGVSLDRVALDRSNFTPLTWAKALLQQLDMPLTGDNVAALVAWEMAEGGHWHNTAHYNPLNTTQPMPGATPMNSVGVKAYRSWSQGFEATIITLRNGYYERILAALRAGDDAVEVAHAVAASPWGTGNFASLIK